MPEGFSDFESPIGTAPYYFMYKNKDTISLNRFESYWGEKPYFKEADLIFLLRVWRCFLEGLFDSPTLGSSAYIFFL